MRGRFSAAIAVVCVAAWTAPALAQMGAYGADEVPNSMFHHGEWNGYGSDRVPTSTTYRRGFRGTYGNDLVPRYGFHPHVNHHRRRMINETIQQLTGSIQNEPAVRTAAPRR